MDHPNVCLCLPTYNESENVANVVENIRKHFTGLLFLVDGFSTDGTVDMAKRLNVPVYSRRMQGKGSAIQRALEVAEQEGKEFLLYFDCDRTYDASDIENVLRNVEIKDLIIGVRPLSKIAPFHRRLGNVIATELINISLNGKLKDSISGFKCLRVNAFKPMLSENSFVIDALICVLALKHQMRIELVPISYHERTGKSKMGFLIGLRELVKLLRAIWKIRKA